MKDYWQNYIDGKFVDGGAGVIQVDNPGTGEKLADQAIADNADVDKAVSAAKKVHESGFLTNMRPVERARMVKKIGAYLIENLEEIAPLLSMEAGKTLFEAKFEVTNAARYFEYYGNQAETLEGRSIPLGSAYYDFTSYEPYGVSAQVIPWNFPLMMAAWKIAPALATGNTVVLKPAETTSLTAIKLAEIIQEADLPAGVVNIITGAGATGAGIVNHPDIDKIAFTGSTGVGKIIMKAIAGTNKKSTMELGGKAANIIFEDAPLDQAVEGVINGIYFNQGHVCCAGSRLFVQESVYELVLRKLKDRIQSLILGDPLDKNTDIGAINSKEQLATINKYLKIGQKEGAEMFQLDCSIPKKGFWCAPTLFTNVSQSHVIAKEEIFGPVLAIQTFRTIDEVITKANNTPFGLSAGVWTDKGSKIFNLTSQMRAGVVWANTYNKFDPTSPFGGYKESGHGREGGLHGLTPYLNF